MVLNVLLDSTYLLPAFGIEVKGISERDFILLKQMQSKGLVNYLSTDIVFIEILGKVHKEAKKKGLPITNFNFAIKSLKESNFIKWIQIPMKAVTIALKIRDLGHKDMIDNLLYATAISNAYVFLTMDHTLRKFLKENGFNVANLKSHKELIEGLENL